MIADTLLLACICVYLRVFADNNAWLLSFLLWFLVMIVYMEIGLGKLSSGLLSMANIICSQVNAKNANHKLSMLVCSRVFAFICG